MDIHLLDQSRYIRKCAPYFAIILVAFADRGIKVETILENLNIVSISFEDQEVLNKTNIIWIALILRSLINQLYILDLKCF